ncbi:MAG: hypothetical protein KAV87_63220, partial [Desulfobacteraceae bacterium]|nr:hypothetical protein [Desulfobacteraceae bacterium]
MSISCFFQGIWYLDKLRRLPGVFEKIARLRKARQLPQDVLAQQQFNALRTLLRHAYDTTRHYRESMDHVHIHPDDIRELVDFRSVPILRKRDIQEDLESLVSRRVPKASLVQDTTGGSTGEPLIFYHDAVTREWFEACDAFVLDSWGVKPWAKKAFLWGADRDIPEMTCRERLRLALERSSFLNSFAMSEEKMAEYARFLMDWRPDYLQGYASSLYLFARFLLGNDLLVPQPNAVRSSAETLYDHQR